jgi:replicative DNA helicase
MTAEVQSINFILDNGISGFKSDYFVDCLEQFNFLKDFVEKYNQLPDKLTFIDKYPDFKIFVVHEPREALIPRLREEVFAKKLIPLYNKCSDMIADGDSITAANLLADKIIQIKQSLADTTSSVDITDYNYKMSEYKKLKEGLVLMKTGFQEFDDLFGGWSNEDLVVIFARLGVGKSWIAIRYAYELVKQGKRVGFYAGEMAAEKLSLRLDSFNTGTSNFSLLMGQLSEEDYSDIAKRLSSLPGKMLVLTPQQLGNSASVDDIKNFIEAEKLDAIFIDQISLMRRDGKKSTHDAISQIANELRVLQSIEQIPMFIVSQQNRSSLQDKEVGAEHIAQSDDIGQNATIAIALEYDKQTRLLTQNIVKSRNSSVAKFQYLWDIDKGRMRYIPQEAAVVDTKDTTDYKDTGSNLF